MGNTTDLAMVQKTIIDVSTKRVTLHKEGKSLAAVRGSIRIGNSKEIKDILV